MRFDYSVLRSSVPQRITSTNFSLVKLAQALHKKSTRDQEGLFTIEGVRELVLAVDNGVQLHSLFMYEGYPLEGDPTHVIKKALDQMENVNLLSVTDRVFQSMCYRSNSGLIAIAHKHDVHLDKFEPSDQAFIVICSGFEKPGNLGAVMRSADAVGAHAVVIESPVLDVFNPNVVRASIGTMFTTPVILSEFDRLLFWLQQHSVVVIATSPDADTNYVKYIYPNRVAIVVGNEAHGLDHRWLKNARDVVSIPQLGQADSLNAATSATVVMYEVLRQRTEFTGEAD